MEFVTDFNAYNCTDNKHGSDGYNFFYMPGKSLVEGYIDNYYGDDFNKPASATVRILFRTFVSDKDVYMKKGTPVNTSNMVISNITTWF